MNTDSSRRAFIKRAATASAGMAALPSSLTFFSNGSPNRKLVVAVMGVRSRGKALAKTFALQKDCEVAYICEVDNRYVAEAVGAVEELQGSEPKWERDIRKILDDKAVDALVIAAPDHWHTPAAIMAIEAGKHVYVEKPCSHNPQEGEWLVAAARKHNRVVQMGNQRRSWGNIQEVIQEIHSGIIGEVYFAKGWYANSRETIGFGKETAVPDYLDWDLWQGPAPRKVYKDNFHPYNWHWFWHWGTGEALNNGSHMVDVMRWGMEQNYPSKVVSTGGRYHYKDDWQTPDTQIMTFEFQSGKTMTWEGRSCNGHKIEGSGAGVIFYGEKGTVVIPGGDEYTVYDNERSPNIIKQAKEVREPDLASIKRDKLNTVGPGVRLDSGHVTNFLDGIRKGTRLNSEIEGGQKSVLMCQLGNISQRVGRSLNIDQINGRILGDEDAMKYWGRKYEAGWGMGE